MQLPFNFLHIWMSDTRLPVIIKESYIIIKKLKKEDNARKLKQNFFKKCFLGFAPQPWSKVFFFLGINKSEEIRGSAFSICQIKPSTNVWVQAQKAVFGSILP